MQEKTILHKEKEGSVFLSPRASEACLAGDCHAATPSRMVTVDELFASLAKGTFDASLVREVGFFVAREGAPDAYDCWYVFDKAVGKMRASTASEADRVEWTGKLRVERYHVPRTPAAELPLLVRVMPGPKNGEFHMLLTETHNGKMEARVAFIKTPAERRQ